jgi:hypothetical protein
MLKSGFRFWIIPSLDVQASNASDLPMVGCLLDLLCEGAPTGATMMIRRSSSAEFEHVLPPISG